MNFNKSPGMGGSDPVATNRKVFDSVVNQAAGHEEYNAVVRKLNDAIEKDRELAVARDLYLDAMGGKTRVEPNVLKQYEERYESLVERNDKLGITPRMLGELAQEAKRALEGNRS